MNKNEKDKIKEHEKKLYNWYIKNRDDYLKDYLEKTEAKNKYLLFGAGGGILSIFKFLDLFKDNKILQGFCWIFMGFLLLMGGFTLLSYIYGAKASATFMNLVGKNYAEQIKNPKKKPINLSDENKDFKIFKNIENCILLILILIINLSILFCFSAFYINIFK